MAKLTIDVPDPMVPRVLAALRALYPSTTEGHTDAQAAREVIKQWVRTALMEHETRTAEETIETAAAAARKKAWDDGNAIT